MANDDQLELLKSKLGKFETQLKGLLKNVEDDLEIARMLQKLLMPNRFPEIQGLKCLARYISAQQLSSDGFDLIPTQKGRELWFVASWTERFGLSSILLQTLVHLQSRSLVEANTGLSVEEVFNDLSTSLVGAKKGGHYRLMVCRLDLVSLKMTGLSQGMFPLLKRARVKNEYQNWEFVKGSESLDKNPSLLQPASSEAPVLADRAHAFAITVEPGSRLFYLSSDWSFAQNLHAFTEPLDLQPTKSTDLLADMNHLLMKSEDHLKQSNREADVLSVAFEVDAGKLHLA